MEEEDFLCLTDMVQSYKRPDDIIRNWLRIRNTLNFLGEWEKLYNPHFKPVEFDGLMRYAGDNAFTISVKGWEETTHAIGIFIWRVGIQTQSYLPRTKVSKAKTSARIPNINRKNSTKESRT